MAPQKSGAAIDGYQCSIVQCDAHGSASSLTALNFADATCHERRPP
ncbi:hypothetical protein GL4_0532 [Methyloceanibacter caenitepidi]|uniref:Uncharacterized protein n=1 Tax=Methyloceanibacter caenitepidi TaxID=1384459 RepID=A0A0A8JYX2_9HYPH|nr:hypothetical protein GL4_0532 [Methyloceanibacter caenitepidi]